MNTLKKVLIELLVLIGASAAVVVVAGALAFVDFNFLGETGGQLQSIAYLAGPPAIGYLILRFFRRVSPLFSKGSKQGFGCLVGFAGLFVVFSPLIIASANAGPGGNMYDESGAGAAIWLMIFSVPFGIIIGGIGIAIFAKASSASKQEGEITE